MEIASQQAVSVLTETAISSSSQPDKARICEEAPAPAIPDYRIVKCIGRGAFGTVWLAEEVLLPGVFRAVKVLNRARFERSDDAARELDGIRDYQTRASDGPYLVQIHRVGQFESETAGPFIYYAMEIADHAGSAQPTRPEDYRPLTLRALLASHGRIPPARCVTYARQLLEALDHLHAHGLNHRDVKPENLLFVRGALKLADMGLVSPDNDRFCGTPDYIPPNSRQPNDLYAAGIVLYELLTGNPAERFPEWPDDLAPEASAILKSVRATLSRACSRDPRKRFANSRAFQRALPEDAPLAQAKRAPTTRRFWLQAAPWTLTSLLLAKEAWSVSKPYRDAGRKYVTTQGSTFLAQGDQKIRLAVSTHPLIPLFFFEDKNKLQVFDVQIRMVAVSLPQSAGGATLEIQICGGYRFTLIDNYVPLSLASVSPKLSELPASQARTGSVVQFYTAIVDTAEKMPQVPAELLYHGQPGQPGGTTGRFFHRFHLPLPLEKREYEIRVGLTETGKPEDWREVANSSGNPRILVVAMLRVDP